jgi:hypothetical protein
MFGLVSGLITRTVGRSPSSAAIRTRTGCGTCFPAHRWTPTRCDDLRGYVIDAFGDDGAVLVVDETGDLKNGVHSVGCGVSTPAPGGSRTGRPRCS